MSAQGQVTIPASSALHSHTRFGTEGGCQVCSEPIHTHFGRQGTWLGCPSPMVPVDAPLILIVDRRAAHPLRRATDRPASETVTAVQTVPQRRATDANGNGTGKPVKVKAAPQTAPKASWVRYWAKFPMRHSRIQQISGETDKAVYTLLARSRTGLSRLELLRGMNALKRTGIVDGAIRRLRVRYKVVGTAEAK